MSQKQKIYQLLDGFSPVIHTEKGPLKLQLRCLVTMNTVIKVISELHSRGSLRLGTIFNIDNKQMLKLPTVVAYQHFFVNFLIILPCFSSSCNLVSFSLTMKKRLYKQLARIAKIYRLENTTEQHVSAGVENPK